ncbi:hypothetical protein ACFRQM_43715 [Streptomyces sp. NPDC056831]|uniref:hypothetical protein n=1 Tax=Streptomyces sp. NPDC056831 TaxID=3345954 RepID=UPI0036B30CA8
MLLGAGLVLGQERAGPLLQEAVQRVGLGAGELVGVDLVGGLVQSDFGHGRISGVGRPD